MKKYILFLTLLLTLFGGKVLEAQDYWVTHLPKKGYGLFMLEVEDGYACLANVGDDEWNYTLTLYKYNKTGELMWYKEYLSPEDRELPQDFIRTSDGGFLIVTHWKRMIKLDGNGEVEFSYNFNCDCQVKKAFELSGEQIYGAYIRQYQSEDPLTYPILVDQYGELIKIDSLNGFVSKDYYYNISVENTGNDELYLSRGTNNTSDNFYSDYDFNPTLEYDYKEYTMIRPSFDGGYYRLPENYFYLYEDSLHYFIKYDENMDSLWAHEYSDYIIWGVDEIEFKASTYLRDGGYAIAGEISNTFFHTVWLIKTDEYANCIWKVGFDNTIFQYLAHKAVAEADDGGFVFFTYGRHHYLDPWDMFLVKTNPNGFLNTKEIETTERKMSVFPNPAKDNITIVFAGNFSGNLYLLNTNGNILEKEELENSNSYMFNIDYLTSGVYFISAIDNDNNIIATEKIIINN